MTHCQKDYNKTIQPWCCVFVRPGVTAAHSINKSLRYFPHNILRLALYGLISKNTQNCWVKKM